MPIAIAPGFGPRCVPPIEQAFEVWNVSRKCYGLVASTLKSTVLFSSIHSSTGQWPNSTGSWKSHGKSPLGGSPSAPARLLDLGTWSGVGCRVWCVAGTCCTLPCFRYMLRLYLKFKKKLDSGPRASRENPPFPSHRVGNYHGNYPLRFLGARGGKFTVDPPSSKELDVETQTIVSQ